jgi:hypothetical protein
MVGLGVLVFSVVVVLFGFVAMALWNKLLPDIFGLPKISYWQAVGLLILARLFFTGIKPGGNKKRKKDKKHLFQDKWENMSEEEQKAFLERHVNVPQENENKA